MFPFHKPLLPSHYSIWFEPPDESGDEVLHIVSERRSLKLKGQSFREFQKRVIPLLDGLHTLPEIQVQTADIFRAEDLEAALNMIGEHGLLAEGDGLGLPDDVTARLTPQLNYFHEMTDGGRNMQAALAAAKIAILGLGGAGAATALGLAAAGIGHIVCIDASEVEPPDMSFRRFSALVLLAAIAPRSLPGRYARARRRRRQARSPTSSRAKLICGARSATRNS